jgi:hypothetical protein
MGDVFLLVVCVVLLSLILAIAVRLNQPLIEYVSAEGEGEAEAEAFSDIPEKAVTSEIAYEEEKQKGAAPSLTGNYDQKTNNELHTSSWTSQITERELINSVNPQLET